MLEIDMPHVILDTASSACPMALKFLYGSLYEAWDSYYNFYRFFWTVLLYIALIT